MPTAAAPLPALRCRGGCGSRLDPVPDRERLCERARIIRSSGAFLRLGHRRMLASVDIDRGTAAIGCMSMTCPSEVAHGHLTFSVECSDRLHGSCGKKYFDFFVDEGLTYFSTLLANIRISKLRYRLSHRRCALQSRDSSFDLQRVSKSVRRTQRILRGRKPRCYRLFFNVGGCHEGIGTCEATE